MRQTTINDYDECFNAIANINADAFLCENDETMQDVADIIKRANDERVLTPRDGQDYNDALERLGFEPGNLRPEKIHVFFTDDPGETLTITFNGEY